VGQVVLVTLNDSLKTDENQLTFISFDEFFKIGRTSILIPEKHLILAPF